MVPDQLTILMPHRVSKALHFQYQISTDQFIRVPLPDKSDDTELEVGTVADNAKVYAWKYTTDISVGKYPDYPDVPASTWTVTLTAMDQDAHLETMEATVAPKEEVKNVKSQGLILVDATFESPGWEKVDAGFGQWRIGPTGIENGPGNFLDSSLQRFRFRAGKKREGSYVLLALMFIVEKAPERHDGDQQTFAPGLLNDCTLICGGEEFHAHRAILAAQSPVFAAMFQSLPDQSSGKCTIDDISVDVLGALLKYVYTRNLFQMEDKLEKMWEAADKYEMVDLKTEAERRMMASIKEGNAVRYMTFAAQHGLNKLMVEAAKIVGRQAV